jgi:hypothetical protein
MRRKRTQTNLQPHAWSSVHYSARHLRINHHLHTPPVSCTCSPRTTTSPSPSYLTTSALPMGAATSSTPLRLQLLLRGSFPPVLTIVLEPSRLVVHTRRSHRAPPRRVSSLFGESFLLPCLFPQTAWHATCRPHVHQSRLSLDTRKYSNNPHLRCIDIILSSVELFEVFFKRYLASLYKCHFIAFSASANRLSNINLSSFSLINARDNISILSAISSNERGAALLSPANASGEKLLPPKYTRCESAKQQQQHHHIHIPIDLRNGEDDGNTLILLPARMRAFSRPNGVRCNDAQSRKASGHQPSSPESR